MWSTRTVPTTENAPYVGHPNDPQRHTSKHRVLIADNSDSALRTTRDYFEEAGCFVIAVKSREAAKLIIDYNVHMLDAIVLDRRLTRDDDAKDSSGRELARETRGEFGELFPIVVYSRNGDSGDEVYDAPAGGWADSPDEIIYMSKEAQRSVLVERVFQRIQLRASRPHRRPPRPSHLPPPIVIFEEAGEVDGGLRAEMAGHEVTAHPLYNLDDVLAVAPHLPASTFVIDLDICERAGAAASGIKMIRSLKGLESTLGRSFYVAALAGDDDLLSEAADAGVDVFLVKDSAPTDALELITRMSQHRIELEQAALAGPQTQLALHFYRELVEQLQAVRESPERGLAARLAAPFRTIERALNWPSLMPQEQLVLTSLHTQLLAAAAGAADDRTIDLCIEGAKLLADDRARRADVRGWSERALRHSADFALEWVSEESFEEMFDDDTEEHDD